MAESRYSHRVGVRMNRVFGNGAAEWSSAFGLLASLALLAGGGLVCAQAPASTPMTEVQTASTTPADISAAVPSSPDAASSPAPSNPLAGANLRADSSAGSLFGLPQTQFPAPAPNSFQSYRGFQGRGTAFMGTGRQAGGFNGLVAGSQAGIRGTAGFGFESHGSFGTGASPNFNQMLRTSYALPFNSSIGTFKLSFRDAMGPGNHGQGTAGAMFSTTNLGNGVFFSAGTNFGKGSMAGTPPGGNMGATGPKPSRGAVALKLSF